MKTRKSVAKRVKISATKKVIRRDIGQGHFNARNPGHITRRKRRDFVVFKTDAENILRNLPYSQ
jgi:ribosomal protein L35